MHERIDAVTISNDALDAVSREGHAGVAKESDGLKDVANDERFEDVEFEVTVGAADRYGDVVAHDLGGYHGDGLALRRVHFACGQETKGEV